MVTIKPNQHILANLQSAHSPAKTQNASKALTESLAKAMPGVIKVTDKQSPEATARNILKHVQNGLNQLRSQGASDERIEQRWQAAQQGIEKGYKEATEMLKGLGLLNDELKQEVDDGRKLVDEGMDALLKNISSVAENKMPAMQSSLKMANEFSLSVLTREGDRVTVNFAQSSSQESGDGNFLLDAQQSWSMEVEGHLSSAEQTALSGLFKDVQSLSERFFAGDIGSALEQAMNLGFDGSQLASLSLNLTQQMTVSSTSPYSQVREQLPTPELESLKAPLASYVDSYAKALKQASALPNVPMTIQDLVEKMLPNEKRMPIWQSFHEGLNQLLTSQEDK